MSELFLSWWKNFKLSIISILFAVLCFVLMCVSIKSCINAERMAYNNIEALTDTIHYYKSKNGDLVASKTILQGDISILKKVNDSLYNTIQDMKIKNPQQIVYIETEVVNEKKDTAWIVQHDTISAETNLRKDFAFNNDYRSLEGNVNYKDNLLGLNITKDEVYLDYTLAVKDNKVYVTSSNPYVKYKDIQGITIPQDRYMFSIGIGPSIGYGYNFVTKDLGPYLGISLNLNYNLIKFGKKKGY